MRAPAEQQACCASLARPRLEPQWAEEPASPAGPTRSWAEQRARCEELSRPLPEPPRSATPEEWLGCREHRTAAAQQKHCTQLAQPRLRDPRLDDEEFASLGGRREHLAARAAAAVPDEVAAAKSLLTEMRERAGAHSGAAASSRPPSAAAKRGSQGPKAGAAPEQDPAAVAQLVGLVEEVLWVALLQVRSCPRAPVAGRGGDNSANAADAALEDRLCSLLVSAIGPSLRPVARRVLGPGQGLVRRLRSEFPRLAVHLGFRESEDAEPPAIVWTAQELALRVEEVRACRDKLLAMDVTKTIMSRLGQP
mmetsp:Transcript_28221/g.58587  ORF Transcript_28221/g.58587 Transcript_28221/m.58587 type:complete len:308 (+) Transcript_28221:3-926(+)